MVSKRDISIDIMKGILILLMVMAHAQGPGHRLIYLFHMAVFFMISGYLWKEGAELNIIPFIKRKIISLYIPYVVCNTAYFVWYLVTPVFFEREICERNLYGVLYETIKIFLFRGRCAMSGPTWFLAVLFIVSIGYALVRKILICKIKSDSMRYYLLTLSAFISLVIGYVLYIVDINLFQIGTIFSSYAAFHLGNMIKYITKERQLLERNVMLHTILAIFAGGGLLILLNLSDTEIRLITNTIVNPIYYCFGMLFGWIVIRYIAMIFDRFVYLRFIFSYLGIYSLIILCAHFAAFRIVAAIQCIFYGLSMSNVSSFPVVKVAGLWWLAYLTVGIGVPLLIRCLFISFKERVLKYNNEAE